MSSFAAAVARVVARKAVLRRQWGQLRSDEEVAAYTKREIRRELGRRRDDREDHDE